MPEHPADQLTKKIYNGTIAAISKSVLAACDRFFRVRHNAAVGAGYDYPARNTVLPAALFGLLFQF